MGLSDTNAYCGLNVSEKLFVKIKALYIHKIILNTPKSMRVK